MAITVDGERLASPAYPLGPQRALLEGVLTERNGDLVVAHEDGSVEPINWSASHHSVRDDGGELVVVDWLGIAKAREGEFVRLGGGETEEVGVWNICGMFEVGEPAGS